MLHFISCFYNFCNYKQSIKNYLIFLEQFSHLNIPYSIIELSNKQGEFSLPEPSPDYPNHKVIRLNGEGAAVAWQKEVLLNILIKSLPPEVDKICWVDPDIIFQREDFYEAIDKALDEYDVVQPFDRIYRMSPNQTVPLFLPNFNYSSEGGFSSFINRSDWWTNCNFGFSHAWRRSTLNSVGNLFPYAIIGGADTIMFNALFGITQPWFGGSGLDWAIGEYTLRVEGFRPKVGYIAGAASHLFHGTIANRRYVERNEILKRHDFSPYEDISLSSEGVWKWATSTRKLALQKDVKLYFEGRKEDD